MRHGVLFAVPLVLFTPVRAHARQAPQATSTTSAFADANQTAPLSREAREERARLLMVRKDYAGALSAYLQILQQDPKNAECLNQAGIAYQELGGLDRAEKYYKLAIRANSHFASAVNNLGTVAFERKDYSKAIKMYTRAMRLATPTSAMYVNLGYAYYSDEKYPEAIDSFQKALALDPNAFETGGSGGAALEERSAPNPAFFFYLVAKSYAKRGDAEHAAQYLKIARDDGYERYRDAEKDQDFSQVINDPRVQDVLLYVPSYAAGPQKTSTHQ